MSTRPVHYPLMDSMRGIAAIAVVATHTSFFVDFKGVHTTQVRFGYISVVVFFVLSAFLLYGPFVRARLADAEPPSTTAFAWRRVLRVVPAYYVALTVIALALGLPYVFTADGIPTFYGFAQVYRADRALNGLSQGWTLCVEALFYVLLPVWAALMGRLPAASRERKVRQELIACAVLVAISFVYKIVVTATGAIDGGYGRPLQLNFVTFMDEFAIGMALATVAAAYSDGRKRPRALELVERYPSLAWGVGGAALLVGVVSLGLLGQVGDLRASGPPYVLRHYLIAVIATGLVLPAMFGDPRRGVVRRILRNRVLLYLGMISYGIYLWHLGLLTQLDRWGFESVAHRTTVVWFAATMAISVVVASISYYVVERPFLKLKNRVPGRPPPQSGESRVDPAPVTPASP